MVALGFTGGSFRKLGLVGSYRELGVVGGKNSG